MRVVNKSKYVRFSLTNFNDNYIIISDNNCNFTINIIDGQIMAFYGKTSL